MFIKSQFHKNPVTSFISVSLIKLPTPCNISYFWNFGSLLGLVYMIQVLTGFFLSIHYKADLGLAFKRVILIQHDSKRGWLIRNLHCNGARLFFFLIYVHIARGLYYQSFYNKLVWLTGSLIYMLRIMIAFLGYVLPWGQMSLWGATVITNLITVIPVFGNFLVNLLWGGFSVTDPTLNRFFGLHFIMPLILRVFIITHLIFLHVKGSKNPLGLKNVSETKIKFYSYFFWKDFLGFFFLVFLLKFFCYFRPYFFLDAANWIPSNNIKTPAHIQPEWYFLFAYAILRTFTSKVAGVLALAISICILFLLPFLNDNKKVFRKSFLPVRKFFYYIFCLNFISLTILGSLTATGINIFLGKVLRFVYFFYFLSFQYLDRLWIKILMKS